MELRLTIAPLERQRASVHACVKIRADVTLMFMCHIRSAALVLSSEQPSVAAPRLLTSTSTSPSRASTHALAAASSLVGSAKSSETITRSLEWTSRRYSLSRRALSRVVTATTHSGSAARKALAVARPMPADAAVTITCDAAGVLVDRILVTGAEGSRLWRLHRVATTPGTYLSHWALCGW